MKQTTRQTPANIKRGGVISEQYKSGMTLVEVGAAHGITRERARQIIAKLGIARIDGGSAIRSFKNNGFKVAAAKAKIGIADARCFGRWGMSMDSYLSHVAEYGNSACKSSPMAKYVQQRKNAQSRGLEWNFTFSDWWAVWLESGKWDQRGLGAGLYVMARYGDGDTPYSVDTVYICTQSQNSKDSYIVSPAAVRFANSPKLLAGSGKGFCYLPNSSKTNPYMAQCKGRYIGSYPTEEAARDAYLKVASGEVRIEDVRPRKAMTADKVLKIRADTRTAKKIADEFQVRIGVVYGIKSRRSFAHI